MVTKKRQKNRVPPSRVRYEAANPTVSVRISQELKQELEDLKITTGMSMADIFKAGLDKIQPDAEEIYERGYGCAEGSAGTPTTRRGLSGRTWCLPAFTDR